jgi:hypothetical protein
MWTTELERGLKDFTGFELFTSSTTNPEWQTGHGVLAKFSNVFSMKNHYPIILHTTESFIRQWIRLGKNGVVDDVNNWLTCMTADAVTKASMDYGMRNVDRNGPNEDLHKFIESLSLLPCRPFERVNKTTGPE